jgi:hypothetical protein
MALTKRQADIREELTRFGTANAYVPTQFADARCGGCGGRTFRLKLDEDEGRPFGSARAANPNTRSATATSTSGARSWKSAPALAAATHSRSWWAYTFTATPTM